MLHWPSVWLSLLLAPVVIAADGQRCYFGRGADKRGPPELVPCVNDGDSACCLQGDTCLSGSTCFNYLTGDLYQYGCTDINYEASVCPYKCGFNTTLSPWTALEYCGDDNVTDTWACHAPESCACDWNSSATVDLLVLKDRSCKAMGSNARVALYAPPSLAPWISLPTSSGGSTGYYSGTTVNGTSTWISTAVAGYTPSSITQLTTYGDQPTTAVIIGPGQTPAPYTAGAPPSISSTTPGPSNTVSTTTGAPTPVTNTPSPSPVSGLSTGAKAGIGVGAAAGACLVLLAAVLIYRRRKQSKQQTHAEVQQHPQGPPYSQGPGYPPGTYPQSPPMQQQGFPYYPSPLQPHEKTGTWQQGNYLPGSPPLPSPVPYYTGTNTSLSPHPFDTPSLYAEPAEPPKAPVSPPLELSAEQRVYEMAHPRDNNTSGVSSPSPTYVEVEGPRK